MTVRRLTVAALLIVTATVTAGPLTAHAATSRTCSSVHVGHRVASRIRTNLACHRARRLVRRWLHRSHLPKNQLGWFCAGRRNVTCGGGNGGNAPFIRFHYRR
jgi:hypothetical protein